MFLRNEEKGSKVQKTPYTNFNLTKHCLRNWLDQESAQGKCPMCRQGTYPQKFWPPWHGIAAFAEHACVVEFKAKQTASNVVVDAQEPGAMDTSQ